MAEQKTPATTGAKPRATRKKAPARAQAQAAIAEMSNKPREGNFRGVKLILPAKLPATFALDMAEAQGGNEDEQLAFTYRLVVGLIGPDGWRAVRAKVDEDGASMDEISTIIAELLNACTEPYGTTPGESEASATS